jgi:mono/diheme cytochrome c family protein
MTVGIVAVALLGAGGCGSSTGGQATKARAAHLSAAQIARQRKVMAVGAAVFKEKCHSCHTLLDRHRTSPTFEITPPNFNEVKPTKAYVKERAEHGGIDMASFSSELTAAQIEAVATYVSTVAGHDVGRGAVSDVGGEGRQLFEAHCHVCHGLAGQPRTGHPTWGGTDLNGVRPSVHWIVRMVESGIEGVMPSFHKRLTRAQRVAVAHYVNSVAGGK